MERIVLAYSGGLDTSVAIPWLAEKYHAQIVAVTLDMGQGKELEDVRDRALAAGAARAHVLDVREEFAREYVLRALKADALQENRSPMAKALGRLLIASKLVEIAGIEQAAAVAHGSAGSGADREALDVAVRSLRPQLSVIAPVRDWGMTRPAEIAYARSRGIPILAESLDTLTESPASCPNEPAYVEILFERGEPTAINGVAMPLVDLIANLGTIAGSHGVGRVDEAYEAPAATVLHAAHRELQRRVTNDADPMSHQYGEMVHSGLWFTPLRDALDAYVQKLQEHVTGAIRLKLFKGDCQVVGLATGLRSSSFGQARRSAEGAEASSRSPAKVNA
ncbi:MAG TPA: argininosuccinate synthase domain-containing protein [Candidatus Limnocylindrales bacterium]|nr:MAG: hypothetical protein A3H95_17895 [Acidobacteria bacterium RIFCSPLOWO2_02_FULL_64_15]OFW29126.1 MAG: hypothetical protein A3G76_16730 [Acidobacteria bacterium RIFCSPLOWO2_12_FULL_65_11]HLB44872.1 argininosuccinate synthase domain-containing protein [Candidatus Limnocylindrales bacterium]